MPKTLGYERQLNESDCFFSTPLLKKAAREKAKIEFERKGAFC
jgi:hypothetical protein